MQPPLLRKRQRQARKNPWERLKSAQPDRNQNDSSQRNTNQEDTNREHKNQRETNHKDMNLMCLNSVGFLIRQKSHKSKSKNKASTSIQQAK